MPKLDTGEQQVWSSPKKGWRFRTRIWSSLPTAPEQVITPLLHHPTHSLVRAGPGASLGSWVDEERRGPDPTWVRWQGWRNLRITMSFPTQGLRSPKTLWQPGNLSTYLWIFQRASDFWVPNSEGQDTGYGAHRRSKKLWGANSIFNIILYLEKQFLKNTWKYKIG